LHSGRVSGGSTSQGPNQTIFAGTGALDVVPGGHRVDRGTCGFGQTLEGGEDQLDEVVLVLQSGQGTGVVTLHDVETLGVLLHVADEELDELTRVGGVETQGAIGVDAGGGGYGDLDRKSVV
jgi:hypothetical protein